MTDLEENQKPPEANAEAAKGEAEAAAPELGAETPEAVSAYADQIESRIEDEAASAEADGERLLVEVVNRSGGGESDIAEGRRSLAGIQSDIETCAAQTHNEVQDVIVEDQGEQWARQGRQAMAERGYVPDAAVAPYKSFGVGERFLIQKCRDSRGREVVVKVSGPNERDGGQLRREGRLLDLTNSAAVRAEADGGRAVAISFPRRLDGYQTVGQEAVVTSFVDDDPEFKRRLTPNEQVDVIVGALKEMQRLPVPAEELDKPRGERTLEVRRGGDFIGRWERFLPELAAAGIVAEGDAKELASMIREATADIDSLPLKLDHGDLHFGNIALTKDAATGRHQTTMMDLEALKATNEFVGVAQILNRIDFTNGVGRYPEIAASMPKIAAQLEESFGVFKTQGLEDRVKREFVDSHEDPRKAERVLSLMLLDEALEGLYFSKDKGGPYRFKQEIYQGILTKRLAEIKGRR